MTTEALRKPMVWTEREGKRLNIPVKIWAEPEDLAPQAGALDQAVDLAQHPTAFHHVALMPDFHQGFGMPIGGVFAAMNAVIPNAVGNDIGCGMMAMRTSLTDEHLDEADLREIVSYIRERIPVGFNVRSKAAPEASELVYTSDMVVVDMNYDKWRYQVGTLGGGNHFIEIDKDEDGRIWVMLHSGSRGIGEKICRMYNDLAKDINRKYHSANAGGNLAWFPVDSTEGQAYLKVMDWALRFAEVNRAVMLAEVKAAFMDAGWDIHNHSDLPIETHHNYAAQEHHFGQNPWVHRKGAVRAVGKVIIPGSMGTASYICEGLASPDSFESCSHGAGRLMSRKAANAAVTHEEAVESMKHVVYGVRQGDYDEMPHAYKDVDRVIQLQSDLVRPLHRLTPLAVVKG